MTIDTGHEPDLVEAVRRRLSVIVGRPDLRDRKLGRADPAAIALALPHQIYSLHVRELAEGVPIQQARPVCKAFLVLDGAAVIATAEISLPEGHVTISEGSPIDALWRGIEMVDTDPGVTDAEVRVLRVPPVNLLALWLHHHDGRGDLIVPVAQPPKPVRAYHRYKPARLTQVLVGVGRRRLPRPAEDDHST